MNDKPRQPKGIPVGGQFAASAHAESGVTLGDVTPEGPDYSTWTPVEVDTELARLYDEHGKAMARWSSQYGFVNGEIARHKFKRGFRGTCTAAEMSEALDEMRAKEADGTADYQDKGLLDKYARAEDYRDEALIAEAAMEPLNEEFQTRGGWTRAFLVANANGHVHKSMDCSSCFRPGYDRSGNWREGTRYHWVTEMSDKTEDEVIDAAGERACTVCYKDAPVSSLNKPTSLFTPDEVEKAKAREERAAAKVEREAKKVAKSLSLDGSEVRIEYGTGRFDYEHFKTKQAATTWLVSGIVDHRYGYGKDREMTPEKAAAHAQVIEMIAVKEGRSVEDVRAEMDKKALAKAKRDGYNI